MSLIDQAQANTNIHKMRLNETAGKAPGPKGIVQPSEFLSILRAELDGHVIDKKTKKAWGSYRKKLKSSNWRLTSKLGNVHAELWKEHIDVTLKSMVKNIRNSQPNGEWVLFDYEVDIRDNHGPDNQEYIVLACEWVDSRNEVDLRYANGVPSVDVHVDVSNNNKELIEVLTKKQDSSSDDELKDLMKQFIAAMAGKTVEDTAKKTTKKVEKKPEEVVEDLAEGFEG